jgi:hypothetical protein
VKKRKVLTSTLTILIILIFVSLMANQPSASACIIYLGRKAKFDMEISPKVPLFHPEKDGYFYPGSLKITKYLKVINVGDLPFRICKINAIFYGDTYLATGLQIEIFELGKSRGEEPGILYNGTINHLSEGIEAYGKRAIPPKQSVTLQLTVWMPETAGNKYQGLNMTADIAITVRFPPAHDGGNN